MATITAADVNKLRKMTGAGMMDCKKALQENDGDFDKAIDFLRKKGQKLASKRADKSANEGFVLAQTNRDNTFASIIMINCETDFVAKNQDFIDFVKSISTLTIDKKPKSLKELNELEIKGVKVSDELSAQIGKIGEKIELSKYDFIEAAKVFAYNHQGNRLATIMGINKADLENIDQVGHEIAMQIAAMNPIAIDKEDVPQEVIDREIEIGKEQARQEGKPEAMLDKIAAGKLNKFFKENTLLNQEFVRDTKKTVKKYLEEFDKQLTVKDFKRFMLGEQS